VGAYVGAAPCKNEFGNQARNEKLLGFGNLDQRLMLWEQLEGKGHYVYHLPLEYSICLERWNLRKIIGYMREDDVGGKTSGLEI